MKPRLKLLPDIKGVAAVEYALVACLISIAALAGYSALGSRVHSYYGNIDNRLAAHL